MAKTKNVKTDKGFRISAKNLAALNMPCACERCFWIKQKCKLPWQIFPGIFQTIDGFTKKAIHAYWDEHGEAPPWMPELKIAVKYLPALHWSKFKFTDPETGITLSGAEDDVFETADYSRIIYDYKTAKFTEHQDKLYPLYEAQLNGYKWIEEKLGNKVKRLALCYFEPVVDMESVDTNNPNGISLPFIPRTIEVPVDDALIDRLLRKAKSILDLPLPPPADPDCPDCTKLGELLAITTNGHNEAQ